MDRKKSLDKNLIELNGLTLNLSLSTEDNWQITFHTAN